MKRMWINQPSGLQPYHKLHGVRVLADDRVFAANPIAEYCDIWFLSGSVVAMKIAKVALSEGWPLPTDEHGYSVAYPSPPARKIR